MPDGKNRGTSSGPAMTADFTLDDFRGQLQNLQKIGMKEMIGRMPGMAQRIAAGWDPEVALKRVRGMIDSMTKKERKDPDIIDAGRRRRIAAGSGVQPHEVSQFLKQFDTVRALMKEMMSMSVWQRIKMVLGLTRFPPFPPPT
jgi:signal recognition particle subunit SRP54